MHRSDNPRLDWQLKQAFLGLLTRIANSKAHFRERLVEHDDQAQIIELGGRRWRVTVGPDLDRDGEPHRRVTPID